MLSRRETSVDRAWGRRGRRGRNESRDDSPGASRRRPRAHGRRGPLRVYTGGGRVESGRGEGGEGERMRGRRSGRMLRNILRLHRSSSTANVFELYVWACPRDPRTS